MSIYAPGVLTTNPGTLKRLTSSFTDPTMRQAVHSFLCQALPANTGKVYIGLANFNKTTGVGVIAALAVPTANIIPSCSATVAYSANHFNLADFWFDVDNP